jgi:Tol biopolymer transport system component
MPLRLCLLGVSFAAAAAACALLAGSVQAASSVDCPAFLQVGWSPDGTRLLFSGPLNRQQSDEEAGIVGIVNADGTSPRILSKWPFPHPQDSDQDPRWTPDGRSVVYEHRIFTGPGNHGGFMSGWVFIQVDLRTGARFVVRGGFDPTFGPGGITYIAPQGVFVNRKLLVRGKFFEDASWSTDGKQLLLAVNGTYEIADAKGRIRQVLHNVSPIAWEPHGNRIAYVKWPHGLNGPHFFYIANADGSQPVRLWDGNVDEFHWSPDGRHIAYKAADGLHLATADGSKQRPIGPVNEFVWSPDGRHIAYTPPVQSDADTVFVANADGSHPIQATGFSGNVLKLLWSPDSSRLVADNRLIEMATGDVIPLPGYGNSSWSPDSSLIAAGAGDGIDILRADGTSVRHISLCTS